MISRKSFLKTSFLGGVATFAQKWSPVSVNGDGSRPIVISTWNNQKANEAAWKVLEASGRALDAVEAGARVPEADPNDRSVGLGGFPDRTGKVTLDACIMNESGRCGSVAFLQHILHPVSVARKVMEESPHVMLVGEGALDFALRQGFEKQNLLTEEARQAWEKWKKKQKEAMKNHDTIGILALDANGNLSGACTTSGTSMKMHGRVGDSPIIGAGLYVDNEVGAASATGKGEEVIRTTGSHAVVELMRQGREPVQACREIVQRIVKWNRGSKEEFQVGFIALNKDGVVGGYSIRKGFSYAVRDAEGSRLVKSRSLR